MTLDTSMFGEGSKTEKTLAKNAYQFVQIQDLTPQDSCNPQKKKELLERVFFIQEHYYRSDYPQVAITLRRLARACLELKEISLAKKYAEKAYTICRIKAAKKLLQDCEEQIRLAALLPVTANKGRESLVSTTSSSISSYTATHVAQEDLLEFVRSVLGWVEAVEEITTQKSDHYDTHAATTFTSIALNLIRKGYWEQALRDPESLGIPTELLPVLKNYVEAHPILLRANEHAAAERLYKGLSRGEINELRAWLTILSEDQSRKASSHSQAKSTESSQKCTLS